MGDYYWTRTTYDLNVLRSKKYNRLKRLRAAAQSYFNMQEIRKLNEQIIQIDSVLDARRVQTSYME